MAYSIRSFTHPYGPVVAVTGDADVGAAAALEAALQAASDAGHVRIMVDLTGATLLDSRTIGVLAGWTARLTGRGGGLPIVCPDPNILGLLRRIGLERSFELFGSREEPVPRD